MERNSLSEQPHELAYEAKKQGTTAKEVSSAKPGRINARLLRKNSRGKNKDEDLQSNTAPKGALLSPADENSKLQYQRNKWQIRNLAALA